MLFGWFVGSPAGPRLLDQFDGTVTVSRVLRGGPRVDAAQRSSDSGLRRLKSVRECRRRRGRAASPRATPRGAVGRSERAVRGGGSGSGLEGRVRRLRRRYPAGRVVRSRPGTQRSTIVAETTTTMRALPRRHRRGQAQRRHRAARCRSAGGSRSRRRGRAGRRCWIPGSWPPRRGLHHRGRSAQVESGARRTQDRRCGVEQRTDLRVTVTFALHRLGVQAH